MPFVIGFIVTGLALCLALFFYAIQAFNALVSLRNQVDRAWANIDVLLKQRHDEIPQLIQVLEQYAQYERDTIDRVVNARTRYGQAQTVEQKIGADMEMSLALKGIMAIGENYPDLKANQQFVQLQTRVSTLESQLADRREFYNETATNLNTRIAQFPEMFFAGSLGYKPTNMFAVAESEKSAPNLKMNLPRVG